MLVTFALVFPFFIFPIDNILPLQSRYMVEALEEWVLQEVINHDVALEALQAELDRVEAEKKWLAEEVVGLR